MSWSCQFGLKLIHMNQKYIFIFSSLIESIKSVWVGGGWNKVGRVTGNAYIIGLINIVAIFTYFASKRSNIKLMQRFLQKYSSKVINLIFG